MKAREWIKIAKEDKDAAALLFSGGRFLYSSYFCQQAVEKALKGVIQHTTKKSPPYIHDLVKLAVISLKDTGDKEEALMKDLTLHYIVGRYTEYRRHLSGNKKERAKKFLEYTGRVLEWSSQKVTLKR